MLPVLRERVKGIHSQLEHDRVVDAVKQLAGE